MAISAKFIADFEAFKASVAGAEASLKSMDAEAKHMGTTMDSVKSTASTLAGVLGVAFSLQAAATFVADVISMGSAISDLSKQSGLSTDALQAFGAKGKAVGITMSEIAGVATQLARRIAGDDTSARAAIGYLGLSFEKLRAQSIDDMLNDTLTALSGVADASSQADLAQQLYGRSGLALLAILRDNTGGFDGVIRAAKEAGLVLGQDSIDTIDRHANAWGRLGTIVKVYSGEILGGLFDAYDAVKAKEQERTAQQKQGEDVATRWIAGLFGIKTATVDLTTVTTALNIALPQTITAADVLANRLTQLKDDAMAPLTLAQREQIAELTKWGVGEVEVAKLVGSTVLAVHLAIEAQRAHATELKKTVAATEQAAEKYNLALVNLNALKAGHEAINTSIAKSVTEYLRLGASQSDVATAFHLSLGAVKALDQELTKSTAAQKVRLEQVNAGVIEAFTLQTAYNKAIGLDAAGAIAHQQTALEALATRLTAIAAMHTTEEAQLRLSELAKLAFTQATLDEARAIDAEFAALRQSNTEMAKVPALYEAAASAKQAFLTGPGIPSTGLTVGPGGILMPSDWGGNIGIPGSGAGHAISDNIGAFGNAGPLRNPLIGTGAGTLVTNHFYVNGTAADVARQVAAEIVRTMKQGHQFGTS